LLYFNLQAWPATAELRAVLLSPRKRALGGSMGSTISHAIMTSQLSDADKRLVFRTIRDRLKLRAAFRLDSADKFAELPPRGRSYDRVERELRFLFSASEDDLFSSISWNDSEDCTFVTS